MMHARTISACLLTALLAQPAHADATVTVELWDRGAMMDMPGMGMAGRMRWGGGWAMGMHGAPGMAMMGIRTDTSEVPAGKVTFNVTNVSAGTIHEMIVAPLESGEERLPYIDKEDRVDEDATGHLGEVSELDPGKSGALTLDLPPGQYVLYCNVPGHFAAGMWTTISVR